MQPNKQLTILVGALATFGLLTIITCFVFLAERLLGACR